MAKKKGIDAQLLGAGLLTLAALGSLAMLVVFLMRGPGGGEREPIADLETPDIKNLASVGSDPQVLSGESLQIQITDEDDPTRLVAEMNFGKLDPLPARQYEASETETWVFLGSGDFVRITAPRAVLRMPDGKRPESGRLMGGVEMRVYDPPRGGGRPDPAFARPKLTANTERFDFDLTIGEVSAPGRLTVHTDDVDFVGSDMEAIVNESQRRIESVRVAVGESLEYRPRSAEGAPARSGGERPARVGGAGAGGEAGGTAQVSTEEQRPGAGAAPPEPERGTPLRQHYRVVFEDAVRVVQGEKEIRGDRLDVWARLVDNELPHDALGRAREDARLDGRQSEGYLGEDRSLAAMLVSAAVASVGEQPRGLSALGRSASGEQPEDGAEKPDEATEVAVGEESTPLELLSEDETVVLRWDGPMTVEFLRGGQPDELRDQNHVAVRFSAPESGTVAFEDFASGARGVCGELFYKATVRQLALSGLGPHAVRLVRPGEGMLEAGRVELDLYTGEASIPGAGIAHALAEGRERPDPAASRRVTWTERADLRLAMRDGEPSGDVLWARMLGRVEAIDGEARLAGEVMDATFFERQEDREPTMRHLEVVGPVTGGDGRGASIVGERLSVDFAASESGRSDPRTVSIEGSAEVRRESSVLRANIVDARLERSIEDKLVVSFVSARDAVRFSDTDSALVASCDRLRADAMLEIANLEGESVSLRQGGDEITGTQVHLNGTERIVEVFGAGTFTRHREDGKAPAIAEASWTKQMVFDDRRGTLDCYGDAMATWRPEPLAIDEVEAERVHVELTPYREQSEGEGALGVRVDRAERKVLRVRAIGAQRLEAGGDAAVIQSLRESPAAPAPGRQRAIETLLRLEGPEIFANNEIGELRVDDPGRLVVVDYREAAETGAAGDAAQGATEPDEVAEDEHSPDEGAQVEVAPDEGGPAGAPDGAEAGGGEEAEPIDIEDPGSVRGSALFEWDDSLVVDRDEGTITMDGRVRMTHIRLGDELATRLLCEHLVAGFESPGEDEREVAAGRLRSVRASGDVYVRSGRQELMGDELLYDARRSTVEAQSDEGGRVTYVDARTGTPSSARRIFWDLSTDRIEIREPGSLVLPR